MGFPEDLGKSIRKGLEVAREKGEQLARFAQLRLDVVNLGREREGLYARLGRSYVENKGDRLTLEPIVAEIERVSKELAEREEALKKLGQTEEGSGDTGTPGVEPTPEAAAVGSGESSQQHPGPGGSQQP